MILFKLSHSGIACLFILCLGLLASCNGHDPNAVLSSGKGTPASDTTKMPGSARDSVLVKQEVLPLKFKGEWVDDCILDVYIAFHFKFTNGTPKLKMHYGMTETSNGFFPVLHTNEKFVELTNTRKISENKYEFVVETNKGPISFFAKFISRSYVSVQLSDVVPKPLKHISGERRLYNCTLYTGP